MKNMKIVITIPKDSGIDEEYEDEIFKMFKLLCDNIGTHGLPCKRIR